MSERKARVVRHKSVPQQQAQTPKFHTDHGVRYFKLGEGMDLGQIKKELEGYKDILLGRIEPPFDSGVLTLMECAEAFHARACEIEMELHELEAQGAVLKGSRPYRFRTGYLRTFIDLCKRSIDLGSRRVTYWNQNGF